MNPSDHLSDAVSAASLVLAVLAALYSLWLGDVNAALAIIPKPDRDDRTPQRKQATAVLLTKALPLMVATVSAALILGPRSVAILGEVYEHHADRQFDDVKALFVLTSALLGVLAIVAAVQTAGLLGKRSELR
jgi:hypothetical protein